MQRLDGSATAMAEGFMRVEYGLADGTGLRSWYRRWWCNAAAHLKGLDAAYRERLHPRRWRRRWCSATPGAIKVGLIVWGRWRISGGCKWVSARRDRWISCLPCWPGRQVWSAWTWLRRRWRCRARLQLF